MEFKLIDYPLRQQFVNACLNGEKEFVLSMIEPSSTNAWYTVLSNILLGAINWNLGLFNACKGGHKDISLMMISRGADITQCSLALSDDNIYYLVQKRVSQFGIYQHVADSFRDSQTELLVILDDILNGDLISVILGF